MCERVIGKALLHRGGSQNAKTPAASFYTGLVPELYAPLKAVSLDSQRYGDLIARHGEPALDLGCGDGDPLLDLRENGLDVDGLDSTPDMIA